MSEIEAAIKSSISSLPGSEASMSSAATDSASTESADTASTESTDSTTTDTDTTTTETAPTHGTTDVVDPAAAAASTEPRADPDSLEGLAQEMAGKRDNRIPHSRVTKIVENQVKKALAESEQKYARYNTPEFHNEQRAMQVADKNPEQFLRALVQVDPRYAELLQGSRLVGGTEDAGGDGTAGKKTAPAGDIEADIQLSDGTLAYSAEAQQRREDALIARMEAAFDKRMGERFKDVQPLVDERRQNELRREAGERVAGRIERARKWPGFNENAEAIAAKVNEATKRGEFMDLHDAYIEVVIPKFRTDEATTRAKVVAEMNKQAAAAGRVGPSGGSVVKETTASDEDPITAAIKDSIKGLK